MVHCHLPLVLDSWSLHQTPAALWSSEISALPRRAQASHWRTALFIREELRRAITHPPPALHKPPSLMFYKGLSAGELCQWRYWAVIHRRAGCRVPDRWFRGCEGTTLERCKWKCETRNTCNVRVQLKYHLKVPHCEKSLPYLVILEISTLSHKRLQSLCRFCPLGPPCFLPINRGLYTLLSRHGGTVLVNQAWKKNATAKNGQNIVVLKLCSFENWRPLWWKLTWTLTSGSLLTFPLITAPILDLNLCQLC